MSRNSFRRHLSMPGMLLAVRVCFGRVPDPVSMPKHSPLLLPGDEPVQTSTEFSFLGRPLFLFGAGGGDPVLARNLRTLFGVARAPSDTWMRERPGGADPRDLRRCFVNEWTYVDAPVSATGNFSSAESLRRAQCDAVWRGRPLHRPRSAAS